jgi:STE24 endopeptidase
MSHWFITLCWVLILAKWAAQMALEWINQQHALRHANEVPPAFAQTMTTEKYAKSVAYTLAKSRYEMIEMTWGVVVLAAVLFSGALSWFYQDFGSSIWAQAGFMLAVGVALWILDFPFEWYAQFRLEEKFGFNTTTAGGFGRGFVLPPSNW